MLEITSNPIEFAIREFAYGALTIFDIAVLCVLANYLLYKRNNWRNSAGARIAFALGVFVFAQMIRSSLFWIEYRSVGVFGEKFNPSLGTIALSISPFIVMIGASLIIHSISADRYRWYFIWITIFLAATVPATFHFMD